MKTTKEQEIEALKDEISRLQSENRRLRESTFVLPKQKTVIVPPPFSPLFDIAEENVHSYFEHLTIQPENAEIIINGERYVLIRSASLSYEFLDIIKELYSNRSAEEATRIGNNFLFDIAHVLGKKDAASFHKKMNLVDPVEKLSAGPVHFAYTGWANVEIFPESNPSPDENYYLKFYHHNSFEAQAWKKAGRHSDIPVCTMNCGYSSGWCEESFGFPLTTVEVECVACGAEHCTFIMAPPAKIKEHLRSADDTREEEDIAVPVFFEKKYTEDRLRDSLEQKETLLREVHHRVKNNLQVISSLLNLQMDTIENESLRAEFRSGIMRINTMARVHEMIYSDKSISAIQVEHYFRHLFLSLVQGYHSDQQQVQTEIDIRIPEGYLEPDKAIPMGLILNEITDNSLNCGSRKGGLLRLELTESNGEYNLLISDTGNGTLDTKSCYDKEMTLIPILCEQVDARLEVGRSNSVLSYRITFKKTPEKNLQPAV